MLGKLAYNMGRCISRGGHSEVYQARHIESGEEVCIKRIKILAMDPRMRSECETEVKLLQMLDHPNLIKYHAQFVDDGELYLVMDLASGGTWDQRVQAAKEALKPIEEGLLWRWLYDVAGALAYLHHRRILHRDVKPSHLFLGEDGQAKLGDFGLSKAMSATTQCAFSCVGTPFYMCPEIVRNEGYSFSSDVWSLGCSIYEMAAGFPPFFRKDKDFVALGAAILSANYPALPKDIWSPEFIDIISKILAVAPGQRPSAQQILDVASCKMVSRIQDFKIIGTLGRGKFSEVHRSVWTAGGDREVALKRIQIFDMDAKAREECRGEVDILKRLDHDTIIKYLDSFIENSELVIVLELAAHGDLAHLIRQAKHEERKLTEPQVWAIAFQASDALLHMHKNRIMHRDLKPANIFVCLHGVVKLGDLGLGRFFSSNTYRAHSVVGTPFYMSPEVITGSGGYDFKSDVWSLGCVLYELATLNCPFALPGLNYYALGNKIANAEYPPLPDDTPERVTHLCTKVLRARQEERPETYDVWSFAMKCLTQVSRGGKARGKGNAPPGEEEDSSPGGRGEAVQAAARRRAAAVVQLLLDGPTPAPKQPQILQQPQQRHAGPIVVPDLKLAQSCGNSHTAHGLGARSYRGPYAQSIDDRERRRVSTGVAVLSARERRAPHSARASSPHEKSPYERSPYERKSKEPRHPRDPFREEEAPPAAQAVAQAAQYAPREDGRRGRPSGSQPAPLQRAASAALRGNSPLRAASPGGGSTISPRPAQLTPIAAPARRQHPVSAREALSAREDSGPTPPPAYPVAVPSRTGAVSARGKIEQASAQMAREAVQAGCQAAVIPHPPSAVKPRTARVKPPAVLPAMEGHRRVVSPTQDGPLAAGDVGFSPSR